MARNSPNTSINSQENTEIPSAQPLSPVTTGVWTTTTQNQASIENNTVTSSGGRTSQTIQQLTAAANQQQQSTNQPIRLYTSKNDKAFKLFFKTIF